MVFLKSCDYIIIVVMKGPIGKLIFELKHHNKLIRDSFDYWFIQQQAKSLRYSQEVLGGS